LCGNTKFFLLFFFPKYQTTFSFFSARKSVRLESGGINPDSETHSPKILAQKFWDLNEARNQVEIIY